ncbi:MAG: acyl-CoA thioesterase [Legionellales bacterium]|nr:acyl-CoA thioesterase [Legionellales bacterium]
MTPDMTNFTGNVHGGYLLSMLDKVAYACAARYTGNPCVTLSVDRVFFKEPIHVGELVTCHASVNYVGKTSLEIGIKVIAENLKTRVTRHTNTSYFTMVAVDETTRKPVTAPKLILNTDIEKRRFEEAELRRDLRLKFYQEHEERKKLEKDEP